MSAGPSTMCHCQAYVRYAYEPQRDDELRLLKGVYVTVLEKCSDGWWRGEATYPETGLQGGWFPSNYVIEQNSLERQMQPTNGAMMASPPGYDAKLPPSPGRTAILETVVCLYSFRAQTGEELSFEKGEQLEIIEHPAHDPEWWRAVNVHGEMGLVPTNYIQDMHTWRICSNDQSMHSDCTDSYSDGSSQYSVDNVTFTWTSNFTTVVKRHNEPQMGASSSNAPATYMISAASASPHSQHLNGGAPSASPSVQQPVPQHTINKLNGSAGGAALVGSLNPVTAKQRCGGPFRGLPWYYGKLAREQADQLLNEFGQDGDFLVRDSESNPGDFSVSLKAKTRNKHFWVHLEEDPPDVTEGARYKIGNRYFMNIDDLLQHYTVQPIYTNDKTGEKLFLVQPLPCDALIE